MNKEIRNDTALCPILSPVAITATTTSAIVDTQGAESLMVIASMGAGSFSGTNKVTLKLQESDLTTTGSFTDVTAANVVGAFAVIDATAATASSTQKVAYIGTKRYVRLVATVAGSVSSVISAVGVLGHGRSNPLSAEAVTATT